ncbi:hypothetical protein BC828DRAFT_405654 [Blastocladiella britannica]|nr:hypothetical protein BC828DRAFT_405654 [Blastocladiella britannica]
MIALLNLASLRSLPSIDDSGTASASDALYAIARTCSAAASVHLWTESAAWTSAVSESPEIAAPVLHALIDVTVLRTPSQLSSLGKGTAGQTLDLPAWLSVPTRWLRRRSGGGSGTLAMVSPAIRAAALALGPDHALNDDRLISGWMRNTTRPAAVMQVLDVLNQVVPAALEAAALALLIVARSTSSGNAPQPNDEDGVTAAAVAHGLVLIRAFVHPTAAAYERWLIQTIWNSPNGDAGATWLAALTALVPHDDPTYLTIHQRVTSAVPPPPPAAHNITTPKPSPSLRAAVAEYHRAIAARLGEFGGAPSTAEAAAVVRAVLEHPNMPVPSNLASWLLLKRKWVTERLLPTLWAMYSGGGDPTSTTIGAAATTGGAASGSFLSTVSAPAIRRAVISVMEGLKKQGKIRGPTWAAWVRVRDDPATHAASNAAATESAERQAMAVKQAAALVGLTQQGGTQLSGTVHAGGGASGVVFLTAAFVSGPALDAGAAQVQVRLVGPGSAAAETGWHDPTSRLMHFIARTAARISRRRYPTHHDNALLATLVRGCVGIQQSIPQPLLPVPIAVETRLPLPWTWTVPVGSVVVARSYVDLVLLPWLLNHHDMEEVASPTVGDAVAAALFLATVSEGKVWHGQHPLMVPVDVEDPVTPTEPGSWSVEMVELLAQRMRVLRTPWADEVVSVMNSLVLVK